MGQYLTGEPVIIADWILLASAYVLVSVRLWFRLLHQRRSLTISDLFLIIAAITVLAVMLIFQQEYALGAMQKGKPQTVDIKKLSFATVLLYTPQFIVQNSVSSPSTTIYSLHPHHGFVQYASL